MTKTSTLLRGRPALLLCLALLVPSAVSAQEGGLAWFKTFQPDTIGPGSVSTLSFEINSSETVPVDGLTFTDTLPAGVVIATPPNATTTCGAGAVLDAPAGGSTITLSGGQLPPTPAGEEAVSCAVRVDVTSATPGVHTNVSGDLTSSLGNHGSAVADLTVTTDRPGFSKSFAPNPITVGQTSALTFTIDNSANAAAAFNLSFTDTLPSGLVIASPANASTSCGGGAVLTAAPGSGTVSLALGSVASLSTCTVTVDVLATVAGFLGNTSGELTSSNDGPAVSSGKASAVLEVQLDSLVKAFTDDPVPPGGLVTLRFTITNFDRDEAATGLSFTDDLGATLTGLAALPPLPASPCGAGSTLSGTGVLTLAGGSLPPAGSCTFDVTLQIPAGAAPGTYPNTTGPLTAVVGGTPVTLNAATDDLEVVPEPVLTKEFTDDPVAPGATVTLEFTLSNTSTASSATGISFTDDLGAVLPGLTAVTLPPVGFCGMGSMISFAAGVLGVSGASLEPAGTPGGSCTFSVTLAVPAGAPGGTFTNTTSPVTATVGGQPVTGDPAADDLLVVGAPRLRKEFTDDPVQPGDTVTLELTLTHSAEATGDATGISFTDDLGAVLPGLAAVPPLPAAPCGPGSALSGTGVLALTGGSLSPGDSCTFSVTVQVPAGAPSGNHLNTTSPVQATVSGVATEGPAASDLLSVAVLRLTKTFLDDPVLPGATVTLRFTIQNLSPSSAATNVQFVDDLAGVLAGLVATDLPKADVCGMGSSFSAAGGGTLLVLAGGSLAAGASCTFDTILQVPGGAASGGYFNATQAFTATIEGETVSFPDATDRLTVDSSLLLFAKEFLGDPVPPGGLVTLRFTLENLASETATGIAFTDDLEAALAGLVSVSGTQMGVCGAGSQLSGASVLTLAGGTLAAGASCVFDVTLQVPGSVLLGTDAVNTTSQATGTVGGLEVTGGPASDVLEIDRLTLTKSFDGPTTAGGSPVLTFTLVNLDSGEGLAGLGFTDDLDAVLPGLVAVAPLPTDPCGSGSTLSGTSVLSLTGGSLAAAGQPGDSCTFAVTLAVPADATPGSFPNTTSQVSAAGLPVGDPATDDLLVEPPPAFGKAFAPDSILVGETSVLTFTVVNTASAVAATGLAFTDALPAGIEVASPPDPATTCSGGTITAVAGSGVVAYTGGTVPAGGSCTVQVAVTATAAGSLLNTSGVLTSSSGTSGTASDLLTVSEQPSVNVLEIPTAGTWGLLLLAALLAAGALWRLRL